VYDELLAAATRVADGNTIGTATGKVPPGSATVDENNAPPAALKVQLLEIVSLPLAGADTLTFAVQLSCTGYAVSLRLRAAGNGFSPYVMAEGSTVVVAVNDVPAKPSESSTLTPETTAVPLHVAVPLLAVAVVGGTAPL